MGIRLTLTTILTGAIAVIWWLKRKTEVSTNMAELRFPLAEVRSLFQRDEADYSYLRGSFVNYSGDLRHAVSEGRISSDSAKRITQAFTHITWDLWNINSLIARLEWMDKIAQKGELSVEEWRQYCSLDIEHFHIELRSILDYAAACIAAAANQPGTVPTSMNDLRNWCAKNLGNRRRLGEDLAVLLEKMPWFPSLREVRDETVHRGGHTLVFEGPGAGIRFQVYTRFFRMVIKPLVDPSEGNIIDFPRYGSLLIAHLLIFLERLTDALRARIPVDHVSIGDTRMGGLGWDIFLVWLSKWNTEKTG